MSGFSQVDELSGRRHAVLVLRLVLDGDAQLCYGELLDAEAQSVGWFASPTSLASAVNRWLTGQQDGVANPGSGPEARRIVPTRKGVSPYRCGFLHVIGNRDSYAGAPQAAARFRISPEED